MGLMLKLVSAACAVVALAPAPSAHAAAAADQATALAAKVSETIAGTEHWAVSAGFPRPFVIAEIAKAVLVAVDGAQLPGPVEGAALNQVASGDLSSAALAAVKIVQKETAND